MNLHGAEFRAFRALLGWSVSEAAEAFGTSEQLWLLSEQGGSNTQLLIDFRVHRTRIFELSLLLAKALREQGVQALPCIENQADFDGEPLDRAIFNAAVRMAWAQNPRVRLVRFDGMSFDALYSSQVPVNLHALAHLVRWAGLVCPEKTAQA